MLSGWFKGKRNQDFGNPLYNLRIQLGFDRETFEVVRDSASPDLYTIANLGEIIRFASQHLQDAHLVTDSGAILKKDLIDNGKYPNYSSYNSLAYPWFDAYLFINRDKCAMNRLIHAFNDKINGSAEKALIELEYEKPAGFKQQVYTKDGMLWVPINKQNPLRFEKESALVSA